MRYRFVGGVADGRMLEIDPQRIKHCVPNPAREKLRPHRTVAVTQPQTGCDTYIPMTFRDDNRRDHTFFMLVGMTPASALLRYRSYEPA